MSAVLSDLVIRESRNDILTMSVIVGTNSAMHSFRSQVGNGSRSHDLAGVSLMIFSISISVASIKVVSGVPEKEFVIMAVARVRNFTVAGQLPQAYTSSLLIISIRPYL